MTEYKLLPYNTEYAVPPMGLKNYGNTCHFNAMLQSVLSCTAVFERLEQMATDRSPAFLNNITARFLYDIHKKMLAKQSADDEVRDLWQYLLEQAGKRHDNVRWTAGQQDAHESFLLLMSGLEECQEIFELFEHRYRRSLYCPQCQQWSTSKEILNTVADVAPTLQSSQLPEFAQIDCYYNRAVPMNTFIKCQNDYVDQDYVCSRADCKKKGPQFQTTMLTMVPEILPIIIKKFEKKCVTQFPKKLLFEELSNTNERQMLVYNLVSQIEHSGSQSGGHYYAYCLRADGKFYELNDSYVAEHAAGPTSLSYMLFYEFSERCPWKTEYDTIPNKQAEFPTPK